MSRGANMIISVRTRVGLWIGVVLGVEFVRKNVAVIAATEQILFVVAEA